MIKYLIFAWLTQDFFAVVMSDAILIPDIYLMCIIFWSFSIKDAPMELDIFLIWAAFVGGLLWDLRWIGVPGFFSLLYVFSFLCAKWIWDLFPKSGQTVMVFFLISWGVQLPGFIISLYLWSVKTALYLQLFLLYQAYSIPLAAFFSLLFARRVKMRNV